MLASWTLFSAAIIFGLSSSFCYYLAVWRLASKGIRVKFFTTPRDTFAAFTQYRRLAAENSWALWPISAFWLFSLLCFMSFAMFAYLESHPPEGDALSIPVQSRGAILWTMASSFLVALVFSYRVFDGTSQQGTRLSTWRAWITDEYTRNDFFLATIGWLGFLGTSLQLIMTYRW